MFVLDLKQSFCLSAADVERDGDAWRTRALELEAALHETEAQASSEHAGASCLRRDCLYSNMQAELVALKSSLASSQAASASHRPGDPAPKKKNKSTKLTQASTEKLAPQKASAASRSDEGNTLNDGEPF